MKKALKTMLLVTLLVVFVFLAAGCERTPSSTRQDVTNTLEIGNTQVAKQPTPTDLGPSITRYLLIRRAYWLNGDFGKAHMVPCPVAALPLGQVSIYSQGVLLYTSPVVGTVVSQDTYLTPDSEYYERSTSYSYINNWLPDVDGTFGSNGGGIFWFEPSGVMRVWGGNEYDYISAPNEVLPPVQYQKFVKGE